jgi:hypothetical protein
MKVELERALSDLAMDISTVPSKDIINGSQDERGSVT